MSIERYWFYRHLLIR